MLDKLEQTAIKNNIPIMINYLINFIKENKVKTILEIGTAIGYSAIKMAFIDPEIKIVTIERDQNRYNEAIVNVKEFGLEKQIDVILADALEIDITSKFDLVFIDAAKAQYIKFFEKFKHNLNKHGIIVSDNLNFHGLVNSDKTDLSRNLRNLVLKIEKYIQFLENNIEFKTKFINIGDGISISRKDDEDEN
mgnify:FL=1